MSLLAFKFYQWLLIIIHPTNVTNFSSLMVLMKEISAVFTLENLEASLKVQHCHNELRQG